MFNEEWDSLFAQPKVASLIWTNHLGNLMVKAVWLERDGNEIVFVGWSEDPMLKAIGRDTPLCLTVESEHRIGQFCARASATQSPQEVAHWGERIWRRYRGDSPRIYSSSRTDTLWRLSDCHCLQYAIPDQREQLFHGYAGDSPEILLAKVIDQANRVLVLARRDIPAIGLETPIAETAFVLRRNLKDVSQDSMRVAGQDLVAIKESGELLAGGFEGCPGWVNLRVVFLGGRPRLVHFECQAPERRTAGVTASQIVLGWADIQKLAISE